MSRRFQQGALILAAAMVIFLGSLVCSQLAAQAPPPLPMPGGDYAPPLQPGGGDQAPPGSPSGPEVLTRGPIHEAFAEVVSYNPQPGQIVSKEPPKAIEEVPPAEKPQGDYTWIPGYWTWDQDRANFIWVTGAWRIPPPGTAWVPGYWNQAANGYQWVGGYWGPAANTARATAATAETVYLPAPPQSVEGGASTTQPSPDHFWVPGNWVWVDGRYAWQAGFWGRSQPDWVWIPARYVWTPGGYVFLAGHWDYALARRGVVFCPVAFADPYYVPPTYYYTPSVCIQTPVLTGYLFCRPAYGHYYFGDYYDPMYARVGIYPWYAVHGRYSYEPLFVYDRWYYGRRDPGWEMRIHGDYEYRVAHLDARPPHTYAAALRIGVNVGGVSFTLAAPIGRVAAGGGTMHFEHISNERREQMVREQHEIRRVQDDRRNSEIRAGVQARASGGQPVRMNARSGAITSAQPMTGGAARGGVGQTASQPMTGGAARGGVGQATSQPMTGGAVRPGTVQPAPRTGTATGRGSDNSKKRDPRDKDQGGR
jgi:hypothetical protein